MNKEFDELTKAMAQSVTRRGALMKFGSGLGAMALAFVGARIQARADKVKTVPCASDAGCRSGQVCCNGLCVAAIPDWCDPTVSCCCYCGGNTKNRYSATALTPCHPSYSTCSATCGGAISLC